MESPSNPSFLARNEFLIRRLHSLSGLVPVGAYMVVHLLTNASILGSDKLFQQNVYRIHSLGPALPLIEWIFIFLPLIFHAVIGVVIVKGGLPNHNAYAYTSNIRYSLQRASGMIAFLFIFWHVFHMHGWFHADWWVNSVATPLGGASFHPFNATSSAAEAIQQSVLVPICYAIGVLACVYHLANGIWTMGITWGVWVSPAAQQRANWLAIALGIGLAMVGMGALNGFWSMDEEAVQKAKQVEDQMYEARVAAGDVEENSEKRSGHGAPTEEHPDEATEENSGDIAREDRDPSPSSTIPVVRVDQ